ARLVAAAGFLVDGRPGAALRFLLGHAVLLVTLGDVLGLAFLLVGVLRFIPACHGCTLLKRTLVLTLSPARWQMATNPSSNRRAVGGAGRSAGAGGRLSLSS